MVREHACVYTPCWDTLSQSELPTDHEDLTVRLSLIAGIALMVVGGFLLWQGGSLTTRRDVLKVGDVRITAEEQHPIQPWAAGLAIAAGIGLIAVGARRRA